MVITMFSELLTPAIRKYITEILESGQNIILDRYVYSGVAFSAAKVCSILSIITAAKLI